MCITTRLGRLCASQSKKQFNKSQTIQRVGHVWGGLTLTVQSSTGYDAPMSIELGINAEFADFYHFRGDHNRQHSTGGGHKPVGYTHGGILSGVRGLQQGFSLNKRGVSSETLEVPDNFWLLLKLIRVKQMNAVPSFSSLLAYPLAIKPRFTVPKAHYKPVASTLLFADSPTGIIALLDRVPVAWIVSGYHHGTIDNKPYTCHFVEVVYHRQTQRGVNLETFEAQSVEDAKQTLSQIFGGAK